MMRALALTFLVACNAPQEPDVAFVVAHASELPALAAATPLRSVGFVATDAATQRAHAERAVELGIRVLVLEPLDADATELITFAHERGVRVVAYGREPAGRADGDTIDALVAFDGYRAGTLQAARAVEAIGHGRVAILADATPAGYAAEVVRGYTHTLAPYIARGDITLVADAASADAVLATDGARLRTLAHRPTFAASATGDNLDLVCTGHQQLDVRLDRAALATAAATVIRRLVAGEDLNKDPRTIRLPDRRLPVEFAAVTAYNTDDCP